MRARHDNAKNWMILIFFSTSLGVTHCHWRRVFAKMEMFFPFPSCDSSFLQCNVYHFHWKGSFSAFVPWKRNSKRHYSLCFAVVPYNFNLSLSVFGRENRSVMDNISQVNRCLQYRPRMFFLSIKKMNPLVKHRQKRNWFCFRREHCVRGAWTRILVVDNPQKGIKVFLCTGRFPKHTFLDSTSAKWTHFPIVMVTVTILCVTHPEFSQVFHSCMQCNIDSWISGNFPES